MTWNKRKSDQLCINLQGFRKSENKTHFLTFKTQLPENSSESFSFLRNCKIKARINAIFVKSNKANAAKPGEAKLLFYGSFKFAYMQIKHIMGKSCSSVRLSVSAYPFPSATEPNWTKFGRKLPMTRALGSFNFTPKYLLHPVISITDFITSGSRIRFLP